MEDLLGNFMKVSDFQANQPSTPDANLGQSLSALSDDFLAGENWSARSERLSGDYSMRGSMAGDVPDRFSVDSNNNNNNSPAVLPSSEWDLTKPKLDDQYWMTIKRLQIQVRELLRSVLPANLQYCFTDAVIFAG